MRICADVRSALRPAVVLLVIAAVPALVAAWWLPRPAEQEGLATPTALSVAAAQVLAARQAVLWVDARDAAAHAAGTVPGAVPLRHDAWETLLPGFVDAWQPGQTVVVFCDGGGCAAARSVAQRLQRELGLANVTYLDGGWAAWRAAP